MYEWFWKEFTSGYTKYQKFWALKWRRNLEEYIKTNVHGKEIDNSVSKEAIIINFRTSYWVKKGVVELFSWSSDAGESDFN